MCVHARICSLPACGGALLGAIIAAGCGAVSTGEKQSGPRSTLNLSVLGVDSESTYYETNPNQELELAEYVPVDTVPRVIRGDVSGSDDIDVFDLGPVVPGDRIVVDMTPADTLLGALALFDQDGTSLLINDHRNVYLGRSGPFIDVIIRHASGTCYVAVADTPGFNTNGDYGLTASRETGVSLPEPNPDTVLLVFSGGTKVQIGRRSPVNVPVFEAADISSDLAGETDYIMQRIVDLVREDYEGVDITILSTSEGDVFESGMTRVYFGTYDEALLGVAEGVDEFNAARSQQAIVFTDTFEAFVRLGPTAEQIAQAMANVTSHEIGHLLGMVHTDDPDAIMDVTASLSRLLRDQSFKRAPVYSAVFPLGYQDDVQYLFDTLGGDANAWFAKARTAQHKAPVPDDGGPPARGRACLSSCCLDER